MIRVGFGYDAHRFNDGNHITIGGIKIPFDRGILAHSDGDVLLHAIGDALLGAAALGDLGQHFPDTDPKYRGIDSRQLLQEIMGLITPRFQVLQMDSTIITETPRLMKYIHLMREAIAEILGVTISEINVKAKTNERMGWIGREEGLAAYAVITLQCVRY